MLERYTSSIMQNASKIVLISLLAMSKFVFAGGIQDFPDLEKTELRLNDGRKIQLNRINDEYLWEFSLLNKKNKRIWSHRYSTEFDSLWGYAYFIKIKNSSYINDLNKDGLPEFALSTWDGGNAPTRPAIVFTVKKDELVYFGTVENYYIESGKPLFQSDKEISKFLRSQSKR